MLWSALRALSLMMVLSASAVAQTSPPASGESAAPAKPSENSGLLGEIGKLLTAPAALLPSFKQADPAPAPGTAEGAAKESPAAGSRLVPGIVTGRELCPRSDNGAPDCKVGSDRLCRGKGYTEGKSLDTDAAFGCSTKLQMRGKPCGTENYVTRAFCQ